MIFRLTGQEQEQVTKLYEKLLEGIAHKKPSLNGSLLDIVNSDFYKLMVQIETERYEAINEPNEILENAKERINDAILYEYAANVGIDEEQSKEKPVLMLTDDYINIADWTDCVAWYYKHEKFLKMLEEPPQEPLFLFARSGIEKHIRKNVICSHIDALKGTPGAQDLEELIKDCLDNSKYIIDDSKVKQDVNQSIKPFISNGAYTGVRRVLNVPQYTAMNSLVSTKIVSSAPKSSKKDIPGQYTMQWDIQEKDLVYFAAVDFKADKNISVDTKIDLYDIAIINAIGSLYIAHKAQAPGEECCLIPLDIWRFMNGKRPNEKVKMSPNQEAMLVSRIEKLRRSFFYMDLKSQIEKYGFTFDKRFTQNNGIVDDTLLNLTKKVIQTTRNGQVTDGYKVNTEPILFTYSRCRKQIITVNRELLNVTGAAGSKSIGEHTIAFTNYLLKRIENYRKGFLSSNIVKLETIYKETGIVSPKERVIRENYANEKTYAEAIRKERARDCKEIDNILKTWKGKKFIDSFQKDGQGENTSYVFEVIRRTPKMIKGEKSGTL